VAAQASAKVEKKGKQKLFFNLIGQSAVIFLSFSELRRMSVVARVLPEAKIVQKIPNCGSIGPNFANLLNNMG
jgi:hypothetical protein